MRDRGWIAAGLVLFAAVVTFPFWASLAGDGRAVREPKLAVPAAEKECVAPVATMKAAHAALLSEWRDLAVRQNVRTYTAYNGRTFDISLTATCLQRCHNDKAAFCDRCHDYSGVRSLNCWDCHVDPGTVRPAAQSSGAGGRGGRDDMR